MVVTVVGTGYVGLVTGACLADVGIHVNCIDVDQLKIRQLKNGVIPIYEPGLEKVVNRNIANNRLHFSTSLEESIDNSDAIFIAVGTPARENGVAELKYIDEVAKTIGKNINHYTLIVTKSTVPIGTSNRINTIIKTELEKRNKDIDFDIASNPEFLKEGAAVKDFMSPDRIIIGVESKKAKKILERIYKPFQLNGYRIIYMSIKSAEFTKYAANAMLATRISFMNEMAQLAEKVGANITDVRHGIGSDPRIGSKFLYPGVGYGGSCFPKDVKALIAYSNELEVDMKLLKAVHEINRSQKELLADKVLDYFQKNSLSKNIGIWGLSFKPNTDDIREAPSITIIKKLSKHGFTIHVYDPVAMENAKKYLKDNFSLTFHESSYDCINNVNSLLLVTEWNEFRNPNWDRVKDLMENPIIFDGRNIYDKKFLEKIGFTYFGIGI